MADNTASTLDPDRDPLTGLPGFEHALARIAQWRARAAEQGCALHAMLIGLRRFDTVNLAYGAAAGDLVLAEVAARIGHFLANELDGPWLAARGGGGTFLVVANEPCSRERWQLLAEQLVEALAKPISRPSGGMLRPSPRASLLRVLPAEDGESLLDRLAQTLDRAQQRQGRRALWADGEITRAGRTAAQLEADLLHAIDRDEIEVVFQPQFASCDDTLHGAEALARWNHPQLGRIGAGALFGMAERADYVAPLSAHIARLALGEAAGWPEPVRLSLNVTPADLAIGSFADTLLATIAASGFAPERLTLEVTEQVLLADMHLAQRALADLAACGIRIALDDFGAGFCNFRYLKLLPLHALKLDRSMVDGVPDDARDLAVLRGIIAMAQALGLEVVAEGIETEVQRACIAAEGCASYQGFLRAAPMGAGEFAAMTAANTNLHGP